MHAEQDECDLPPPLEYESASEASPVFGYQTGDLEVVDDDQIDNLSHLYTSKMTHVDRKERVIGKTGSCQSYGLSTELNRDVVITNTVHTSSSMRSVPATRVAVVDLTSREDGESSVKFSIFEKMMSKSKIGGVKKASIGGVKTIKTSVKSSMLNNVTTSFATCPVCDQAVAASIIEIHVDECQNRMPLAKKTKEARLNGDMADKDYKVQIGGTIGTATTITSSSSGHTSRNQIFQIPKNQVHNNQFTNNSDNNHNTTSNSSPFTFQEESKHVDFVPCSSLGQQKEGGNAEPIKAVDCVKSVSIQHYDAPLVPIPSSRLLVSCLHPESQLPQSLFYSSLPSVQADYAAVGNTYLSNSCVQVNMQEPCLAVSPLSPGTLLPTFSSDNNTHDVALDSLLHTLKDSRDRKVQALGSSSKLITPVVMCYLHILPSTSPVLSLPTPSTDSWYLQHATTELAAQGIEAAPTVEKSQPQKFYLPLLNFNIQNMFSLTTRSVPWNLVKAAQYSPKLLQEVTARAVLGYQNQPPPAPACTLPPSVLKSLLQKAVRRSNVSLACKAARMLAHTAGINELARRLPIVAAEDAVCHPASEYMCFISCISTKKTNVDEAALKIHHLDELLTFTEEIASCQVRDVIASYHWSYPSVFEADSSCDADKVVSIVKKGLLAGAAAAEERSVVDGVPVYHGQSLHSLPGLALLRDISAAFIILNECIQPFLLDPLKFSALPQAQTPPLVHVTLRSVLDRQLGLSPVLGSMVNGLQERACLGGMHGDVLLLRENAVMWCIRGGQCALYQQYSKVTLLSSDKQKNGYDISICSSELNSQCRIPTLLKTLEILAPYLPFALFPRDMPKCYVEHVNQVPSDNLFDLVIEPSKQYAFTSLREDWELWLLNQMSPRSRLHCEKNVPKLPWKISKSIKDHIHAPTLDSVVFQTCTTPNMVLQSSVNSFSVDMQTAEEFILDSLDSHCSDMVNYLLEARTVVGKAHLDAVQAKSTLTPDWSLLSEYYSSPHLGIIAAELPTTQIIKLALTFFLGSSEVVSYAESLASIVTAIDKDILGNMMWVGGGSRTNKRAVHSLPASRCVAPPLGELVTLCCNCRQEVSDMTCSQCGVLMQCNNTSSSLSITREELYPLPPFLPPPLESTITSKNKVTQLELEYYLLLREL